MSDHDRDRFDPEDLVARARRGLLSRGEQEQLAHALEASPELATAYRVGVEIDRASAVQGGDDAVIARAADAAMARVVEMTTHMTTRKPLPSRAAQGSRWAAAAAVALSVICASGLAAALTGAVPWPFRSEPEPAAAPSVAPATPKKKHKPKRAPIEAAAIEVAPTPVIEPPEPITAPQRMPKAGAGIDPADDAATQFHDANEARRNGELKHAQRLYGRLIEQHPSSDEAGFARVSLGRLLLAAGDARAAEREFRSYLAGGGGQLSEEALVGQAQSFGRLKRANEEQKAWQRLLASYPSSVYAAQAKQRLAVLDAAHEQDGTR